MSVLHCTILQWRALHYITLHYTILHYTALYHTTLHCTVPYYITLYYTILHYTALYHTTFHCTVHSVTNQSKTSLHCRVNHRAKGQFRKWSKARQFSLHCTALPYTPLYRTTQPSTPLYYLPTLRAICNVLNFGVKTNFKVEAVLRMLLTTFKPDGAGPVDNTPSTDKLHHLVKKKKLYVRCDTWHVTGDMWHVTRDTWHVTCLGGWTFSQNFSSLALIVCDLWYYEDLEKAHRLN